MITFGWFLLAHLLFGILLMDYLCPHWHPFEKLVGAMIWPVSLAAGIGLMIRKSLADRRVRAYNAHTRFHLMSQIKYMDVCQGVGEGPWA